MSSLVNFCKAVPGKAYGLFLLGASCVKCGFYKTSSVANKFFQLIPCLSCGTAGKAILMSGGVAVIAGSAYLLYQRMYGGERPGHTCPRTTS